jgi:hypothetical protein
VICGSVIAFRTRLAGTPPLRTCRFRGDSCNISRPPKLPPEETKAEQMSQDDKKTIEPKGVDQSHKPAKQIEEVAKLASSVETAKDPGKTPRTKD